MRLIVIQLAMMATLVSVSNGEELLKQCICNDLKPCKQRSIQQIIPCADRCEKYATNIGNYQMMRACILQKRHIIEKILQCIEDSFLNSCSNGSSPHMIPRRYSTGIELAAVKEINNMMQKSGVASQMKGLLTQGRRYFKCFQSCITSSVTKCSKNCGLNLPPDNVVVQTVKTCAVQNGVNTASVQDLCNCVERAGVRQLAGVCSRLQISKKK